MLHRKSRKNKDITDENEESNPKGIDLDKLAANVRKAEQIVNKFTKQTAIVKVVAPRNNIDVPLPVPVSNWTESIDFIANTIAASADGRAPSQQQKVRTRLDTDARIDDLSSTNYFGPDFTGYEQLSPEQYEALVEQALKQFNLDGEVRQVEIRAKRVRWVKGALVAVGITTIVGLGAGAFAGYPILASISTDALKTTAWYTVYVIWPSLDGYKKDGWKGFAKEALQAGFAEAMRSVNVVGYLFPVPSPGVYERWSRWSARLVATGIELSGKEILKGTVSAILHIEDRSMIQKMAADAANRQRRSLWIENRLRNGEPLESVIKRVGEPDVNENAIKAFVKRFGQKGKLFLKSGLGKMVTTITIALSSAMYHFDVFSKLSALWKMPYIQEKVGDYVIEPGARMVQTFLLPIVSRYLLMNKLKVPQMLSAMFRYFETRYGFLRTDIRELPPIKQMFKVFERLFGQQIKWNMSLTAAANLVTANTLMLMGTEAMLPIADPKRVRWFYDHWDGASTVNGLTDVFKSIVGKGDFWELVQNPMKTALPWLYNHVSKVNAGDVALNLNGDVQFTITKVDNIAGLVTVKNPNNAERVIDMDIEGPVLDEFYLRNPATSKLTPIRVGRLRANGLAEAFHLRGEKMQQEDIDRMVSYHPAETKKLIDLAKKVRTASEQLAKLDTAIASSKATFELASSMVETATMNSKGADDPIIRQWKKAVDDVIYENLLESSKTELDGILSSGNGIDDKVTKMAMVCGGFSDEAKKILAKDIAENKLDVTTTAIRSGRYFKAYSSAISTSMAKEMFAWKKQVVQSHSEKWTINIPTDAPSDKSLLGTIANSQDESNPMTQYFRASLDTEGFAKTAKRGIDAIKRWEDRFVTTWSEGGRERTKAIGSLLASDTLISAADGISKLKDTFKKASDDLLVTESLVANPGQLSDTQASRLFDTINTLKWLSTSRMDAAAEVAAAEINGYIQDERLQDAYAKLQQLLPETDLKILVDEKGSDGKVTKKGLRSLANDAEQIIPENLRHPTLYHVADMYNAQKSQLPSFAAAVDRVNKEVSVVWRTLGWDVKAEVKGLMGSFEDHANIGKLSEFRKHFRNYRDALVGITNDLSSGIDRRKTQIASLASKIQQAEADKYEVLSLISKANDAFTSMASVMLDIKEGNPIPKGSLAQISAQIKGIETSIDTTIRKVESRSYDSIQSIEAIAVNRAPLDPSFKAKYSSSLNKADMNSKLNRLEALGVSKTALQHPIHLAKFATSTSTNTKNLDALATMLGFLVSTSGEDTSVFTMNAGAVDAVNQISAEMDKATDKLAGILKSLGEDASRCMDKFVYNPATDKTEPPGYEPCLLPALLGRPVNAAIDMGIETAKLYGWKKWAFNPVDPVSYLTLAGAYGAQATMTVIDTYGIANTPNMFSIIESDDSTAEDRSGAAMGVLMAAIRCAQSSPPYSCHTSHQLTGGVPTGRVTGYWTWMDLVVTAPDMITPEFVQDATKIMTSANGGWAEKMEAAKAVARLLTTSATPLVETLLYGAERTSMLRVHYNRYKELMAKSDRSHLRNVTAGLSHLGLDVELITDIVGKMRTQSCFYSGIGCETDTKSI